MPAAHSELAPSSAKVWGAPNGCTGYVRMMRNYIERESGEAAKLGTLAHTVPEAWLRGEPHDPQLESLPEGPEMLEGAGLLVADVHAPMCRDIRDQAWHGVEARLEGNAIHANNFGTCDVWWHDPVSRTLYVWDYKFGYISVEAYENWQGINYAALILEKLESEGLPVDSVDIRIVQPRAFHKLGPIRHWTVPRATLQAYIETLRVNAHTALSNQATLNAGPHCRYCRARHDCAAINEVALWAAEYAHEPTPMGLSPDSLGRKLATVRVALKALEYVATGVEAELEAVLKSGQRVKGWGMESKAGRKAWTVNTERVVKFGDLFGVDLRKEPDAITPAQAKKAGLNEKIIDQFTQRVQGKIKLVQVDINKEAHQAFGE